MLPDRELLSLYLRLGGTSSSVLIITLKGLRILVCWKCGHTPDEQGVHSIGINLYEHVVRYVVVSMMSTESGALETRVFCMTATTSFISHAIPRARILE